MAGYGMAVGPVGGSAGIASTYGGGSSALTAFSGNPYMLAAQVGLSFIQDRMNRKALKSQRRLYNAQLAAQKQGVATQKAAELLHVQIEQEDMLSQVADAYERFRATAASGVDTRVLGDVSEQVKNQTRKLRMRAKNAELNAVTRTSGLLAEHYQKIGNTHGQAATSALQFAGRAADAYFNPSSDLQGLFPGVGKGGK